MNQTEPQQTSSSEVASPRRPTIAYLAPQIVTSATPINLWVGVEAAARACDFNLIAFPGEVLHLTPGTGGQGNVIYPLITPEKFTGIISWTASLLPSTPDNEAGTQALHTFYARYAPLPLIALSRPLPGHPTVMLENRQGMREAIVHLIEVHGRRRIAFIRGPEGHPYAAERYQTYLDSLTEYGLPIDPTLITPPGGWEQARGGEAVTLFLDERHLRVGEDIQAIMTASDIFALTAMEALQNRGIRVPEDIAIVGFNDSPAVRCTTPSITSIAASLQELGQEAGPLLMQMLQGRPIPEKTLVASRLVIRQSCGCMDETIKKAGSCLPADSPTLAPDAVLRAQREVILQEMRQAARSLIIADAAWAERLLNAFTLELEGSRPGEFLITLREVLRQASPADRGALLWQDVLSVIQHHTPCEQKTAQILPLLGQARTMLAEAASRAAADQQLQETAYTNQLHTISATLISTFNPAEVADVLARDLPGLGIPSGYLALYEDTRPYQYPQPAPAWSRLIMAYTPQERIPLADEGLRFVTRDILPAGMLPADRRYTMLLQPLYLQDTQIGFILLEVGTQTWSIYETLRNAVSSALEGALLVQRIRERSAELARQQYILDTFMENVPDRIYFKDRQGRITRANQAHAQRMGLNSPEEEIGMTDFDFFPTDMARVKLAQEQAIILTGRPLLAVEEQDARGDWSLTTKMPLRDETGAIIGTFGISRDITTLKRAQQELQSAYAQIVTLNAQLKDENVQMRTEMALARRIQTALLPKEIRDLHPDFDIATVMLPAAEVGGDYYDIAFDREGALWFGIGDVAGHGVTPGLIMMMAQTIHTAITTHYSVAPRDVVVMVNEVLFKNVQGRLSADHFMTFTTLKYQGVGHFQYAGSHLDIVIYRAARGKCEAIPTEGLFLNMVEDISNETCAGEFTLEIGDVLVLYTDGLLEVWNEQREILGMERFMALIEQYADADVVALRDTIIQDVLAWSVETPDDDITLVVARRIQ